VSWLSCRRGYSFSRKKNELSPNVACYFNLVSWAIAMGMGMETLFSVCIMALIFHVFSGISWDPSCCWNLIMKLFLPLSFSPLFISFSIHIILYLTEISKAVATLSLLLNQYYWVRMPLYSRVKNSWFKSKGLQNWVRMPLYSSVKILTFELVDSLHTTSFIQKKKNVLKSFFARHARNLTHFCHKLVMKNNFWIDSKPKLFLWVIPNELLVKWFYKSLM